MSHLNDSDNSFGACEGDLDSAVTILLLKLIGKKFVWMANPIIHDDNYIDLVHCTAPRQLNEQIMKYNLLTHHESGKGVSPQVSIPLNKKVTLARIGNNLNNLYICQGLTTENPELPTCRTQIKIQIPSSKDLQNNLLGTHLVMCFGDIIEEMELCADLLNLDLHISQFNN